MILEKDIGGNLAYPLDGGAPPDSVTYSVRDPAGVTRHTGTVASVPVAHAVEATEVLADGLDVRLTFGDDEEVEASLVPGALVRCTDSEGRTHDLVCSGRLAGSILVSGITLADGESISSVWCPEIELEIPDTVCDEIGDGYRVLLTAELDSVATRDAVAFAVAPYSIQVPLNVRTFLDWHPEFGQHQSALIRRRDWPRLVRSAIALLETKLKAADNWLQLVATPFGLQRAAAEALYYLVGEDFRPSDWQGAPGDFEKARARRLSDAIKDLLANSIRDDGVAAEGSAVPEPDAGFWRITL